MRRDLLRLALAVGAAVGAQDEVGHDQEVITAGVSLGAYHAVHLTLQRADVAPLAIGLSGNYDPTTWNGWGELGDATYFANPTAYVANMEGDHLDWVRSRVSVLLVVGQGRLRGVADPVAAGDP